MTAAVAAEKIDVGAVLAETYEVTRLLGKGGMGAVWEAKHLRLQDKRVAIKVLLGEVASNEESVIRFKREANIASQLGHANIVEVYDISELPDGSYYIVLEYLEGEDLAERLVHGAMPPEQTLPIIRQVGSALQAAHEKGIVHRDLKPGNIRLVPTEFGGYATELAKVLDFGISKMQDSATLKTQTSTVLGTPQYMAPEQALGEHKKADARTDIFALGCIVYEMLSGRIAFQGSTIPEIMFKIVYHEPDPLAEVAPFLAPELCAAVHKAIAKKQDDRYADMSEFIEALTGDPLTTIRGGQPALSPAGKPPPPSMASLRARSGNQAALAATATPAGGVGELAHLANPFPDTGQPAGPGSGGHPAQSMVQTAQPMTGQPMGTKGKRSIVPLMGIVFVAVAAAVGIALFLAKGSDEGDDSTKEPAVAQNASADNPANGEPGGEPGGTVITGQNPKSLDGTPDEHPTKVPDGTPVTPDQKPDTKKPNTKKPNTKKPNTKKTDKKLKPEAAEYLKKARTAFKAGKPEKAVKLAHRSVGVQDSQAAWLFITRVHCKQKDISKARPSSRKLKGSNRGQARRYCAKQGLEF